MAAEGLMEIVIFFAFLGWVFISHRDDWRR
jgi:hypothetical protein